MLAVGLYVGWLDKFELQTTNDMPADQFAGTIGGFAGSYPEWKWLANVRYTWHDLEIGLSWQYVDSTVDNSRFFKPNDVTIPHKDYFDVDAGYIRSWMAGSMVSQSARASQT